MFLGGFIDISFVSLTGGIEHFKVSAEFYDEKTHRIMPRWVSSAECKSVKKEIENNSFRVLLALECHLYESLNGF